MQNKMYILFDHVFDVTAEVLVLAVEVLVVTVVVVLVAVVAATAIEHEPSTIKSALKMHGKYFYLFVHYPIPVLVGQLLQ